MKKHLTEEHKMKLRLANVGKKHKEGRWTLESRKKHSEMMTGKKLRSRTAEEKQQQSIRIKKVWTKEMREEQSKRKKGKKLGPWSDERKRKHSILCTDRKMSLASRLKTSGSNHWNWKGGISSFSGVIRDFPENIKWIKQVLARDNYTCQKCDKYSGELVVHHKKALSLLIKEFLDEYNQFSIFEDRETLIKLAIKFDSFWNTENGITFCDKCHKKFHSIYGCDGTNTTEQVDDYLSNK